MLKYSKNCEGAEDLQEALTSILGILKAVNDSMHQIAITGYDVSNNIFNFFRYICTVYSLLHTKNEKNLVQKMPLNCIL